MWKCKTSWSKENDHHYPTLTIGKAYLHSKKVIEKELAPSEGPNHWFEQVQLSIAPTEDNNWQKMSSIISKKGPDIPSG